MPDDKYLTPISDSIQKCITTLTTKGHIKAVSFRIKDKEGDFKVTVSRAIIIPEVELEDMDDADRQPPAGD